MPSFRVKVKHQHGDLDVEVDNDMTVAQLKEKIAQQLSQQQPQVSAARLRLIVLGRVMTDSSPLSAYGLEERHVIHMLIKPADEASAQQPRPQPLPESATRQEPMDDAAAAPAAAAAAIGALDLGGIFRGLIQQVGTTAAAFQQAQRMAQDPPTPNPAAEQPTTSSAPAATAPSPSQPSVPVTPVPPVMMSNHPTLHFGPTPFGPPPSFGPIAAFHVHLHVNMSELDSVPASIQRLQQRMAQQAPTMGFPTHIHVQTHDPTSRVAPSQPSSAAPGRSAPSTAASAQRQPTSSTTAPPAPADASPEPRPSLLTVLKTALQTVPIPEALQAMSGHWAFVERIRGPVRAFVAQQTGTHLALPNAAIRNELMEAAAAEALSIIDRNSLVRSEISSRVRDGVDWRALLRGTLCLGLRQIVELCMDPSLDVPTFAARMRTATVRLAGLATSFFERRAARNGPADTDALTGVLANLAVTEMLRSRPDIAPFANMAIPLLRTTMRSWQHEYQSTLRSATDDALLEQSIAEFETAPSAPPTTSIRPPPSAQPASTAAPADGALDDLLDQCLNTVGSDTVPQPESASRTGSSELETVLMNESRLAETERRQLASMVARDLSPNHRPVVRPPPDAYFDAYRASFE